MTLCRFSRFVFAALLAARLPGEPCRAGEPDVPGPVAIAPADPAPLPWAGLPATHLRDQRRAELTRDGFVQLDHLAEAPRILAYLRARESAAWLAVRNAAYRQLEFSVAPGADPAADPAEVPPHRLSYYRVEVRLDRAAGMATELVGLQLLPYARSGGWPRRTASSLRDAIAAWTFFDGRRHANAQYPCWIGRPPAEGRAWWGVAWEKSDAGRLLLKGDGSPPAILDPLEAADVLLFTDFHDEATPRHDDFAGLGGALRAAHPFYPVLGDRNHEHVQMLARLLDPEQGWSVSLHESEAEIVALAWHEEEETPNLVELAFHRGSGLPSRIDLAAIRDGRVAGGIYLITSRAVTTEEGEVLHLPVARIDAQAPPTQWVEWLGAGPEHVAYTALESSVFLTYDRVNDTALEAEGYWDFAAAARRAGLRFGRAENPQGATRPAFGPATTIYGPEENDLGIFARWDEEMRAAIAAAGLPVSWDEDFLPFSEILARRSQFQRGSWARWRWEPDGTPVQLMPGEEE